MRFLTNDRKPKVICIGMSAMDYIWNVVGLPVGGIKVKATEYIEMGGGMAATSAVAATRLGARTQIWARAGDDSAGRATREEFARYGVDTTHYRLFPGVRTSTSGVFVDAAGERMLVNFRGEGLPTNPDWLPLAEVEKADAILADPRWVEGVEAVFGAARAKGVPTILDGELSNRDTLERIVPLTDYAIFSEIGLASLGRGSDAEVGLRAAFGLSGKTVALTRGGKGSLWFDGKSFREFPAFPIEVVDTTGAGDVFHGAFAVAIGAGADLDDAITFSSAAAALKCTKAGGRPGIPDLATTKAFLERHGH